jgi:tetratricopeptide (TPR) repeat protein
MQRLITLLAIIFSAGLIATSFATAQADDPFAAGKAKAANGDIQGALQIYEALARDHPESAEAFAHLGGMQLLDQRYRDAVQSFQQAVSLGDQDARAFIGMGMAYLHLGQLGPARAAFVEAQNRGNARPEEIAEIIAWIDRQGAQSVPGH